MQMSFANRVLSVLFFFLYRVDTEVICCVNADLVTHVGRCYLNPNTVKIAAAFHMAVAYNLKKVLPRHV